MGRAVTAHQHLRQLRRCQRLLTAALMMAPAANGMLAGTDGTAGAVGDEITVTFTDPASTPTPSGTYNAGPLQQHRNRDSRRSVKQQHRHTTTPTTAPIPPDGPGGPGVATPVTPPTAAPEVGVAKDGRYADAECGWYVRCRSTPSSCAIPAMSCSITCRSPMISIRSLAVRLHGLE